jgi:hypothetical protein
MVVTWDGGLYVGRVASGEPLARSDEKTTRVKVKQAG